MLPNRANLSSLPVLSRKALRNTNSSTSAAKQCLRQEHITGPAPGKRLPLEPESRRACMTVRSKDPWRAACLESDHLCHVGNVGRLVDLPRWAKMIPNGQVAGLRQSKCSRLCRTRAFIGDISWHTTGARKLADQAGVSQRLK